MAISTYQFCMTRWRGIFGAYGYAMPCALTTLLDEALKSGGALVPTMFHAQGIYVPISRGGPPTCDE